MTHPVYVGGPMCNPHCPGEYSAYHEGYSDGYQACHQGVIDDVAAAVSRIRSDGEQVAIYAGRPYESAGFGKACNEVLVALDALGGK